MGQGREGLRGVRGLSVVSRQKDSRQPVPDSASRQIAAQAVFWLLAAAAALAGCGGAIFLATAFGAGKIAPVPFGLGLVLLLVGVLGVVAAIFFGRHARLVDGKLKIGEDGRLLQSRPWVGRCLKWSGHAAGIITVVTGWLHFLFPSGIRLP